MPAEQSTTNPAEQDPNGKEIGRNSVYRRVPPDLRRRLDQAIVDHDPPTYREIYEKYALSGCGVSYWAFYRYAQKIRFDSDMLHIADMALPDDADIGRILPRILALRLFQMAFAGENVSARDIFSATHAYRFATAMALDREKHAAGLAAAARKAASTESNDFIKQANQFLTIARADLKNRQAELRKQQAQQHGKAQPERSGG